IIGEEKGLILLDGSAQRYSKLVLSEDVEAGRGENALRIHSAVSKVFIDRTVKLIRSAARDDVHNACRRPAKLGGVVGIDHAKFAHGVLRRRPALDSRGRRNVVG